VVGDDRHAPDPDLSDAGAADAGAADPGAVDPSAVDPSAVDPSAVDAERMLAELGAALCARIVAVVPDWVERAVEAIIDAWVATRPAGGVDREVVGREAQRAGATAAAEVAVGLQALLGADVDAQWTTPLEVIRAAVVYPTGVLLRAGVPPVVRDSFAEARFPDDVYGLTPASLGAVDASLTDPARAWGAAKAMAHKARHRPA